MEGFEDQPVTPVPKTDWSATPQDDSIDSTSQPTRYDLRSTIPDSRTGNEEQFNPPQPLPPTVLR